MKFNLSNKIRKVMREIKMAEQEAARQELKAFLNFVPKDFKLAPKKQYNSIDTTEALRATT